MLNARILLALLLVGALAACQRDSAEAPPAPSESAAPAAPEEAPAEEPAAEPPAAAEAEPETEGLDIGNLEGWERVGSTHPMMAFMTGEWAAFVEVYEQGPEGWQLVHTEGSNDGVEAKYLFGESGRIQLQRIREGEVAEELEADWHLRAHPEQEGLRLVIEDDPQTSIALLERQEDDTVVVVIEEAGLRAITYLRRP